MNLTKNISDFSDKDLLAIAIKDLRKINVPVELMEQIALPITNCTNVIDYVYQRMGKAIKENESPTEVLEDAEKFTTEVNQNGTE